MATPTPTGDDHPDAYPNGTSVVAHSVVPGVLEDGQDVDVFVLQNAKAQFRYTAVLTSSTTIDADLRVLNEAGSAVAFGGAAKIAPWTASTRQLYYVVVDSNGGTGAYSVEFREVRPPVADILAADDHPDGVPQGTLVDAPVLGTPVYLEGVLENAGDTDVFRFVSGTDGYYDVWIIAPDTLTVSVVNSTNELPGDYFNGHNFISWTTDPGVTWYIRVSGVAADRYRLQLWVPN